jgi:hypothetical protein
MDEKRHKGRGRKERRSGSDRGEETEKRDVGVEV